MCVPHSPESILTYDTLYRLRDEVCSSVSVVENPSYRTGDDTGVSAIRHIEQRWSWLVIYVTDAIHYTSKFGF